jgi:transcription initiation factor TFIIIB Brf1 subunit/transcription initiation factor TFIIB
MEQSEARGVCEVCGAPATESFRDIRPVWRAFESDSPAISSAAERGWQEYKPGPWRHGCAKHPRGWILDAEDWFMRKLDARDFSPKKVWVAKFSEARGESLILGVFESETLGKAFVDVAMEDSQWKTREGYFDLREYEVKTSL